MSAYFLTLINGNENFGGYISVDGQEPIAVSHDMTYEIDPGEHEVLISSTPDFDEDHCWNIDFSIRNGELFTLEVYTAGYKFIDTPRYLVEELDSDQLDEIEEAFEELNDTPSNGTKRIVWGAILTSIGLMGIASGAVQEMPASAMAFGMFILGGSLLLFFGIMRKVRNKK